MTRKLLRALIRAWSWHYRSSNCATWKRDSSDNHRGRRRGSALSLRFALLGTLIGSVDNKLVHRYRFECWPRTPS